MRVPGFRVFWMHTEGGIYDVDGAWYWQDDDCEEPMGPFSTRHEAMADYKDCRGDTDGSR